MMTIRSMSARAFDQILKPGERSLDVHRQRLPERDEAGMHLAANGAAVGANCLIFRQKSGFWRDFIQKFADRQGVPDPDALIG